MSRYRYRDAVVDWLPLIVVVVFIGVVCAFYGGWFYG